MSLSLSAACRDALEGWLSSLKALDAAADNTIEAYRGDVTGFLVFMTLHKGAPQGLKALEGISVTDMRAWMAHTRTGGVGSRSLARKLSAVKTFFGWLAERQGIEPTAVLAAGLEVETYHPGPETPLSLSEEMMAQFLTFFPHLNALRDFGRLTAPRLTADDMQSIF